MKSSIEMPEVSFPLMLETMYTSSSRSVDSWVSTSKVRILSTSLPKKSIR